MQECSAGIIIIIITCTTTITISIIIMLVIIIRALTEGMFDWQKHCNL